MKAKVLQRPPVRHVTVGELYGAAVRARLGAPAVPALEESPAAATPGEMLLWSLGGWICDPSLHRAIEGLRDAVLAVTEREDFGSDAFREELHRIAMRVRVIAALHAAALGSAATVLAEGGAHG